jgi:hypothetical protein
MAVADMSPIILREIERSVPASLFLSDDQTSGFNINSMYSTPLLRAI